MCRSFNTILIMAVCSSLVTHTVSAQTVRIMPLGNSITYDHNSFDDSNPRPTGDRISYRYKLYQLLNDGGFDFDFVGSEDAGNNYFQNQDYDDNAGFPGIQSDGLATLISTGYNDYSKQYVSPGPYLNYHPADIILLHIGTNNLITSPDQVEDVLDNIRFQDSDVIILVARILNRRTYHSPTTTFNDNVELMVNARGDNRIKMVNIETGAGINYAADLVDDLHPNQVGYDKIATKWYSEIMNLNQAPVITNIPVQNTDKGASFTDLNLNQYVSDQEDPDYVLVWTYEQSPDSRLTISIDASHVMHVTPDPDWSGVETVSLEVKDSGSGAFVRSASTEVTFMVEHVNSAPVIASTPPVEVLQGDLYHYTLLATDEDEDSLSYMALEKPSWLTFNASMHTLSGTPGQANIGEHNVVLEVSDGMESVEQAFEIVVEDSNDPPVVTSSLTCEVYQDQYLSFTINADDLDGDPLSYEMVNMPTWLAFNATLHTLTGKPTNDEVGRHNLTVKVSDGTVEVFESIELTVLNRNDLPVITSTPNTVVELGESFLYEFTAEDIDPHDTLFYSAITLPDWLNFLVTSNKALVYGTPDVSDYGANLVILQVSDGEAEIIQAFNLSVSFATDAIPADPEEGFKVYPNPVKDHIRFEFGSTGNSAVYIYDINGILQAVITDGNTQFLEADVSGLPAGLYFYQFIHSGVEGSGKFIKH